MLSLARIFFTVGCFGAFIVFVFITYRRGAKQSYQDIAQSVMDDDDNPEKLLGQDESHENGANK